MIYVDELVSEEPGEFELVEHVRTITAVEIGWTQVDGNDFCPEHGP